MLHNLFYATIHCDAMTDGDYYAMHGEVASFAAMARMPVVSRYFLQYILAWRQLTLLMLAKPVGSPFLVWQSISEGVKLESKKK